MFIVWAKKAIVSLSCLDRLVAPLRVGRPGDCHALSHQDIKGGRLTVPPGRSDRAVHGGIVGTQRARQDPMKQEQEQEQQKVLVQVQVQLKL